MNDNWTDTEDIYDEEMWQAVTEPPEKEENAQFMKSEEETAAILERRRQQLHRENRQNTINREQRYHEKGWLQDRK